MSLCVFMRGKNMSSTPFFFFLNNSLKEQKGNRIWITVKDREERTEGLRMSTGRLSWGHLTVGIRTHFKHVVNIEKALFEVLLNNASFTADLWPPSATVGKRAVNTRSVSTLMGHAPVFPLACECDFLKHCCVNKPKRDRKDGVCPGHVDVWRLCLKKGHWHKKGPLLRGVKRKSTTKT